ncbi:hypothetical protein D5F92_00555 [Streptococcus agalactiae]|nr:hypothetical protein D5F92_00555 [Streptococcus agalactiae]RRA79524.1 hypothetical protein D5F82_10045 [Streptococcus agalactiae]
MSYFYYRVFEKIQSQLSLFQLLYLHVLQILFYSWTIQLLFQFQRIYINYPSATIRFLTFQLLIFLIARYFTVFIKHRIYLLTPTIKNAFLKEDRELIINEIEESLQKSLEFTKWSCGILSTILALVLTMFFNAGLKILDRTISNSALTKELAALSLDPYKLTLFFVLVVIVIIGIVLAHYFIVQLFSFHKRLVLKVLKNCNYESSYYLSDCSKWKIFKELTKEAFLWNYIWSFIQYFF